MASQSPHFSWVQVHEMDRPTTKDIRPRFEKQHAETCDDAMVIPHDLLEKRKEWMEKKRYWREEFQRLQSYLDQDKVLQKPTLFSLDIEAYEFNQNIITEIGISTLDLNIASTVTRTPPKQQRSDSIRARHFRIKERKNLVNKKFVCGCPENFGFGKSEWISERDITKVVSKSLREAETLYKNRPLKPVLVGHNVKSDIDYLRKVGLDILPFVSDCLDTDDLNKWIRQKMENRSLGSLLNDYAIPAEHLHNAGNDAYYTMRLLLATAETGPACLYAGKELEVEIMKEIQKEQRLAEFKVRMRMEGWREKELEVVDYNLEQGAVDAMQRLHINTITEATGPKRHQRKRV